jgi:hypothetical protein
MTVCYPEMERAGVQAKYDARHQKLPWHDGTFTSWAKDRSDSHPYHHSSGTTIWVSTVDHGLGGDFLGSALEGVDDEQGDHSEHQDDQQPDR